MTGFVLTHQPTTGVKKAVTLLLNSFAASTITYCYVKMWFLLGKYTADFDISKKRYVIFCRSHHLLIRLLLMEKVN
jgi:hypothetical protein